MDSKVLNAKLNISINQNVILKILYAQARMEKAKCLHKAENENRHLEIFKNIQLIFNASSPDLHVLTVFDYLTQKLFFTSDVIKIKKLCEVSCTDALTLNNLIKDLQVYIFWFSRLESSLRACQSHNKPLDEIQSRMKELREALDQ